MTDGVIRLDQLQPQQLLVLRKSLESEVNALTQHVVDLRTAIRAFETSKEAIKNLDKLETGTKSLLNLSESVFVCGELIEPQKVLIDIGTGYYVERTTEQADQYYTKRISEIGEAANKAINVISQKRNVLGMVDRRLRANTSSPDSKKLE